MRATIAVAACLALSGIAPTARAFPWERSTGEASTSDAGPIRVIKIAGTVAETPNPWDVFQLDSRLVFSDLLAAIEAEGARESTKVLLVKMGASSLGIAQLQELAQALARARGPGRKVIVQTNEATAGTLLGASAADEVVLAPEGTVIFTGVQAEVAFYRDLLDTLGLEADLEAVGRYKSAPEAFTRNDMSPAAREALDALLDSLYESLLVGVSKQRDVNPAKIRETMEIGLLTAEEARKHRLIDRVAYWPELVRELEKKHGAKAELAYPRQEETPELGSVFGLLQLFTKTPGEPEGNRPKIALLSVEGPVIMGRAQGDLFSAEDVVASADVVDALREIEADERTKAIVFRIDSPGGSALASDLIWTELRRVAAKRPVVASLGNTAASGGYYIASAADRIVAQPTTITGSIGVFGGKLVVGKLLDKIGVRTVVFRRGQHAGIYSSLTPFTDSERALVRKSMQRVYDTFVNRVAKGRGMSYDAVHRVAEGRVWTGEQAKRLGLVDTLGGLDEAIAAAAKLAKLDPAKVQIVNYPKAKSLMDMLQAERTKIMAPRIDLKGLVARASPGLARRVAAMAGALDRLLEREKVLTMLPYVLAIE